MKGKSWSIPIGMVFKKYYCCKCGNKLKKEQTHRVVTKEDKDYYQYQKYNTFPRYDQDVYDFRFMCPSCEKRISFTEQCIIERIQHKCQNKILSSTEIKENYNKCKQADNKRVLIRDILVALFFNLIGFTLFFFFGTEKQQRDIIVLTSLFLIVMSLCIIGIVKHYKGSYKLRKNQTHSHEHISKMEKLQAYSSHNKDLIIESNKCYCYYCLSTFNKEDIIEYIDNDKTALCPHCKVDTVLPDSIDDEITKTTLKDMHDYWF